MLRLFSVYMYILADLPSDFMRYVSICILRTHAAVRIKIDAFSHVDYTAAFASSALSKCFSLLTLF